MVEAGRTFELLATNPMGAIAMATPALSGNMRLIRTRSHLFAVAAGK